MQDFEPKYAICVSVFASAEGNPQASSVWVKYLCMYEAQGCLRALALAPLCLNASHAKRPFLSFKTSTPLVSPSPFVDHLGEKKAVFSGGTRLTLAFCKHGGWFQRGLEKARVTHADGEMPQLIFATALNEPSCSRQTVPGRCAAVQTRHVNRTM